MADNSDELKPPVGDSFASEETFQDEDDSQGEAFSSQSKEPAIAGLTGEAMQSELVELPGYDGPQVYLPDRQVLETIEQIESAIKPIRKFRLAKSVSWSLFYAFIGSVIWAVITVITDYQLGLIAILVGVLAGKGAGKGGTGMGAQRVGAACAAIGYFFGQFLCVLGLLATSELPLGGIPPDQTTEAMSREARPDAGTDPQSNDPKQDPSPDDSVLQPAPQVDLSGTETTGDEGPVTISDELGETPSIIELLLGLIVIAGVLMSAIVAGTFTSIDILFLGFAVYEGYRIPASD